MYNFKLSVYMLYNSTNIVSGFTSNPNKYSINHFGVTTKSENEFESLYPRILKKSVLVARIQSISFLQ